jgi:predicted DNA-binding protein with PD1-like motif
MKYSVAKQGRTFIIRLEDGEMLQDSIEKMAEKEGIERAFVQVVGGIDKGSRIITGPEESRAEIIVPIETSVDDMHEIVGNGTIFPGSSGKPKLHLHIACGRRNLTICGDIRSGVKAWHVIEVIIVELLENNAKRVKDLATGFELLQA